MPSTANTRSNGHVSTAALQVRDDAIDTAQRETVAAIAYDLMSIKRHEIDVTLFPSPAYRATFIALSTFHNLHPTAGQAPFSRLAPFIVSVPELHGLFSDATLTVNELAPLLDPGWHTIGKAAGNVAALKDAAWDIERRERLLELDNLPRDRFIDQASALIARLRENSPPPAFKIVSAAELAANAYPLDYAIPGLLVEGQPAVIGGGKKSLKTTLLLALVLSLSSGCRFLGEFVVKRRYRCGVMSGESGAATIKETSERIAQSSTWVNLEDYDLLYSFDLPKLGKPNTAAELIRFIRGNGLEVLGIDPLYLAMQAGDGASNLYSMGDKLAPLSEVIAETGCTIILAHHARKTGKETFNRFAPPELDDLAFAGISEFARQWLLVNRREEYDPENGGHHELWLASGGSAGHSGLWALSIDEGTRQTPGGRFWQINVSKASEARREAAESQETARADKEQERQRRDEQRLLDAYREYPDGETASIIRAAVGMNATRFGIVNATLLKRKAIVPCRIGKGRCQYDGFRLHSDRSDNSDNFTSPNRPMSVGLSIPLEGDSPSVRPSSDRNGKAEDSANCPTSIGEMA